MPNRIKWIDVAKGGTIFLVVFGHVLIGLFDARIYFGVTQNILLIAVQVIYVFHMPFFFALSGYFFKAQPDLHSYLNFIKKRLVTLGLPYLAFSVIIWAIKFIFGDQVRTDVTFKNLLDIWMMPIGPLWFIYVLFALDIVLGFVSLKVKNIDTLFLVSLMVCLGFTIFPVDWYVVQRIAIWSPIFLLGTFVRKHPIYQYRTTLIASLSVFVTALALWAFTNPIQRINYQVPGWAQLLLFTSVILGFGLFYQLPQTVKGYNYFTKIGQISLPIYLIHVPLVSLTRILLYHLQVNSVIVHLILGTLIGWYGTLFIFNIIHRIPVLDFWIYPGNYLKKKEA